MDNDLTLDQALMKNSGWIVVFMVLLLFVTGCVSHNRNTDITVTSLDPEGFLQDMVGDFDVYTGSFQVNNPTNQTIENVDVDITLATTSSYCHGLTKTFSIPRLSPLENRTVEVSVAEFGNLNCQYDYSYQVFTQA
ncbi:MAG: hypothetical protein Q7T80_00205 [Methanoregula sp.]|nr:hypothetical protein [Methanoregula sp.]